MVIQYILFKSIFRYPYLALFIAYIILFTNLSTYNIAILQDPSTILKSIIYSTVVCDKVDKHNNFIRV